TYCYASYADSGPHAVWDGTDDAGQPVADGTYTVQATVTDADGATASGPVATVLLDRRDPAVLVEPVDGASASGLLQFGMSPTAGISVYQAYFGLWPLRGNGCTTSYVYSADLDGVWRAPLDTGAAGCGDGPRSAYARVYWRDALGGYHSTWVG